MEKRVHMSCMVVPMLVAFVFVLYVQRHLDWLEGLKARLGRCGTNLEGNAESERSQKLKAQIDDAEHQSIPWMSQSCVRGHIWRYALAVDLCEKGAVKRVCAGTFEVQSGTTPGMAYTVELGLKGNQKTFKSLVKNCTCKDFLKRGPGCKHVGAVLIGLAARTEPPGTALVLEAEARARAAVARPGEVPRRVRLELGDTPRGEAAGSAFEPPARRAGVQAFASVKEKAERPRDAE